MISKWQRLLFMQKITLENCKVKLIPAEQAHQKLLQKEALDPRIWTYSLAHHNRDEISWNAYYEDAMEQYRNQKQLPFVVICKETSELVGMTRFYDINEYHSTISLGYTWLRIKSQRTGINRNNKFLLGNFVFHGLNAERLHFDIDNQNQQSRKNLLGIGAKEEGLLRSHRFKVDISKPMEGLNQSYTRRDTSIFSILSSEWPQIKASIFKNYDEGHNIYK